MSFIIILLLIAGGVLISVVLPIVKEGYPKAKTELVRGQFLSTIWGIAKPYLLLGIGSVATALLIMAGGGHIGGTDQGRASGAAVGLLRGRHAPEIQAIRQRGIGLRHVWRPEDAGVQPAVERDGG